VAVVLVCVLWGVGVQLQVVKCQSQRLVGLHAIMMDAWSDQLCLALPVVLSLFRVDAYVVLWRL